MDSTAMVNQMFSQITIAYWWVIPLLLFFAFLKTPFMKGVFGELIVNLTAKFFLDKEKYHLFKNVTLPTEDGTTQIDHVIVSRYIRFIKSKIQLLFSDKEIGDICTKIELGRLKPSTKTHINHVQHVKEIIENKQRQPIPQIY